MKNFRLFVSLTLALGTLVSAAAADGFGRYTGNRGRLLATPVVRTFAGNGLATPNRFGLNNGVVSHNMLVTPTRTVVVGRQPVFQEGPSFQRQPGFRGGPVLHCQPPVERIVVVRPMPRRPHHRSLRRWQRRHQRYDRFDAGMGSIRSRADLF